MKIGFDIRFFDDGLYAQFVEKLICKFVQSQDHNSYVLYTNKNRESFENIKNLEQCIVSFGYGSIKEQIYFPKILQNHHCDVTVFFQPCIPYFFSGKNIIFVEHLKNIYYQNFSHTLLKHMYLFGVEKSFSKAQTVLCFEENTQKELTERFDINGDKISIVPGFFPQEQTKKKGKNLVQTNILNKYHIKNDFILYAGGNGIEKNLEKLVHTITKIDQTQKNIDIVFLGDNVAKNISLRDTILKEKLEKKCHFVGDLNEEEKKSFYETSCGVVFPSLYESFCFELFDALNYGVPILSSNIENLEKILGKHVSYFSPLSRSSMNRALSHFLEKNIDKCDYNSIFKVYNCDKTLTRFSSIIQQVGNSPKEI
ncbi:glycosyltransferase [Candidatus Gracilibacteria bacterium]|nr:glycosyltransferase [Candidatus Gracilibacteria bacterium]